MTLQERLYNDMKEALKTREAGKKRLSVIRLARAALKNQAIAFRRELTDEDVVAVLARELKQRRDSIDEYTRFGRMDVVTELQAEISVLKAYLPQQLSREDIVEAAREVIAATDAREMRDLGRVMGALMPKMNGRADGKMVQDVVRTLLAQVGK